MPSPAIWSRRLSQSASTALASNEDFMRLKEAEEVLAAQDQVLLHGGARLFRILLAQALDDPLVLGGADIFVVAFLEEYREHRAHRDPQLSMCDTSISMPDSR